MLVIFFAYLVCFHENQKVSRDANASMYNSHREKHTQKYDAKWISAQQGTHLSRRLCVVEFLHFVKHHDAHSSNFRPRWITSHTKARDRRQGGIIQGYQGGDSPGERRSNAQLFTLWRILNLQPYDQGIDPRTSRTTTDVDQL